MPIFPAFTVFDVETTGLDPRKGDRIIEIAGVRVENGNVMTESPFVALVNPERTIPWEAKQVNKITDEAVASAPTIDQVLPKFLEFAAGSILVAHNCEFDMGFLLREKELCWGYVDIPECLSTMRMSQTVFPKEFRHNLDMLALRLGLVLPRDRHRALPDVLLTAQVLLRMIEKGNIASMEQLRTAAGSGAIVSGN